VTPIRQILFVVILTLSIGRQFPGVHGDSLGRAAAGSCQEIILKNLAFVPSRFRQWAVYKRVRFEFPCLPAAMATFPPVLLGATGGKEPVPNGVSGLPRSRP
jgi:hypothetical protein